MAAHTVLINVDMIEKEVWDKILELANDSESISALTEVQEELLSLADKAEELLALLDDSGDDT